MRNLDTCHLTRTDDEGRLGGDFFLKLQVSYLFLIKVYFYTQRLNLR